MPTVATTPTPFALPSGRHHPSHYVQNPNRIMAVGLASGRHAADEEARAEVDVLHSRLERTTQLTKKIQACLGRLETTGRSVRDVSGPLNGETKHLQTLGHSAYAPVPFVARPLLRQTR